MGRLVASVLEPWPEATRTCFRLDRIGGRKRYAPLLESWGFEVISSNETPRLSRYHGRFGGRPTIVDFEVGADTRHHTTAAASCISKLRRELAMKKLNQHWCTRVKGLKPTAGYWQDGLRFLSEIESVPGAPKMDGTVLRRNK